MMCSCIARRPLESRASRSRAAGSQTDIPFQLISQLLKALHEKIANETARVPPVEQPCDSPRQGSFEYLIGCPLYVANFGFRGG